MYPLLSSPTLFFFNHPPPTYIYTLSLHDALPIFVFTLRCNSVASLEAPKPRPINEKTCSSRSGAALGPDRKSTRLNSSHQIISYAVFCLKKKKTLIQNTFFSTSAHYHSTSDYTLS